MDQLTVEDKLRAEYFDLLPDVRLVLEELETEIRYAILRHSLKLDAHEYIRVVSRVKECESAIGSLRRGEEGSTFDESKSYTLTALKDLAGVRLLVFPTTKMSNLDDELRKIFPDWTPAPVFDGSDSEQLIALKYFGHCGSCQRVIGEYQIVPMLFGLFWDVEHSALYKPTPRLAGVAESIEMNILRTKVYSVLKEFAETFEQLARKQ